MAAAIKGAIKGEIAMFRKYSPIVVLVSLLTLSWPAAAQDYPITDIDSLIEALTNLKKGSDKVIAGVVVATEDGSVYSFLPSEDQSQTLFSFRGAANCGSSRPVIYVQSGGGFEYRWCVKTLHQSAYMDVYVYLNGSLYPKGSFTVECSSSSMPGPVRIQVQCP